MRRPRTRFKALKDVNLEIKDGQFIGIIGHTGSGKSTLIQHLNGLMKATSERSIFMDRIFMRKILTERTAQPGGTGVPVSGASAFRDDNF